MRTEPVLPDGLAVLTDGDVRVIYYVRDGKVGTRLQPGHEQWHAYVTDVRRIRKADQ